MYNEGETEETSKNPLLFWNDIHDGWTTRTLGPRTAWKHAMQLYGRVTCKLVMISLG